MKATINDLRKALRERRRLEFVGVDNGTWRWSILSTDGSYHHDLYYDEARTDAVCATCESRHGANRCWARKEVLAWLEERVKKGDISKWIPNTEEKQ